MALEIEKPQPSSQQTFGEALKAIAIILTATIRSLAFSFTFIIVFVYPRICYAKVGASFEGSTEIQTLKVANTLPDSYQPTAVAIDAHSNLIVTDSRGNRIWSIDGRGIASLLAGPSISDVSPSTGFNDGKPSDSRFSEPSGIAIDKSGIVYIADTGNSCIRKIENGEVTTYAGRANVQGMADGTTGDSLFTRPSSIAISDERSVYVADGPNGIREIKDGKVSTLPLSANYSHFVNSISLFEGAGTPFIFYTTPDGFGRFNLSTMQTEGFYNTLPGADGIVALANDRAVISIPKRHAIYFSDIGTVRRLITGNNRHSLNAVGEFENGSAQSARFNTPRGLALGSKGEIYVADSGNKQIRIIPTLSPQWMIGDPTYAPEPNSKVYRIVYVSNSFAFQDSMWNDSVEGRVQNYLNLHAKEMGLQKTVKIDAVRFGGAYLVAQGDYIREILGQSAADLVIWDLNSHMFRENFDDYLDTLPQISTQQTETWRESINLAKLQLEQNGTKLLLIDEPLGMQLGPGESYALKDFHSISASFKLRELTRTSEYGFDFFRELESFLSSTKAPFVPTYHAFLAYERGPHRPLFINDDFHPNPNGTEFFSHLVIEALKNYRPWSK